MITKRINGEEALAMAAHDEEVLLATGYPGSPGGGIISILERDVENLDAHWSANEKIAIEKAIGVAINGAKALVCVKSVGLNAMLDPLTVVNLTPLTGALVIVVGDDPGGYGSQNDQDSRRLAQFLNLPWFEPSDPQNGYTMVRLAFRLSGIYGLPVFIRITRSFAGTQMEVNRVKPKFNIASYDLTSIIEPRFVPRPSNAVAKHQELNERMSNLQKAIPLLNINKATDRTANTGLVLCGHVIHKTTEVCNFGELQKHARVLLMHNIHPINTSEITEFLTGLVKVTIIEENTPVMASQIMAIAAQAKLKITWQSIAQPGEIFRWQIAEVLIKEFSGLIIATKYAQPIDEKPKLKGNCTSSRYDEVLDLLDECANILGKKFNYFGDPGCLVSVSDRLYGKYAMGGSISTVFGANIANNKDLNIALIGDSGFFHSALPAMIDAAYHGTNLPMILLNNSSALTTGGQYHPGINQTEASQRLDYKEILQSCGVRQFQNVNINQNKNELIAIMSSFLKLDNARFLQIDIDAPLLKN